MIIVNPYILNQTVLSLIEILPPAYGYSTGDPGWTDSDLVDGGNFTRVATRSSIDHKAVGIVPGEGLVYPPSRFSAFTWDGITTGCDYINVTSSFKSAVMSSLRMVLTFDITMPDYSPTGLYAADKSTLASQAYFFSGGKRWAFGINQAGYLYVELDSQSQDGTFQSNASPGFTNGARCTVQADIIYNASNPGHLNGVSVTFRTGPDRDNLTAIGTPVSLGGYEGGWGHSQDTIAVGAIHGGYWNIRTYQFKGTIHNMTISDGTTELVAVDYENMDQPYSYETIESTWVNYRTLNDPYDLGRSSSDKQMFYTAADANCFGLPTVGVPPGSSARYVMTGAPGMDNNNPQSIPGPGFDFDSFVWIGWGTKTSASGTVVPGPYAADGSGYYPFAGAESNTGITSWGTGGNRVANDPAYLIDAVLDGDPHLCVAVRNGFRWDLYVDDMTTPFAGYFGLGTMDSLITKFYGLYNSNGNLWTYFGGNYEEDVRTSPNWPAFEAKVRTLTSGALPTVPVAPPAPPLSYDDLVLTRNPLVYAPFDETSGSTFHDLSSNALTTTGTGSLATASPVAGPNGRTAQSTGLAAGSVWFQNAVLSETVVTLEWWARTTTTNSGWLGWTWAPGQPENLQMAILLNYTPGAGTVAWSQYNTYSVRSSNTVPVNDGNWHHYVMTTSPYPWPVFIDGMPSGGMGVGGHPPTVMNTVGFLGDPGIEFCCVAAYDTVFTWEDAYQNYTAMYE